MAVRRLRALVRSRPLASYLVCAYAISWGWWVPMVAAGAVSRPGQAWPTHLPGLLGPGLAAVVVTGLADGSSGLTRLRRRMTRWRTGGWWWLLVAGTVGLAPLGVLVLSAAGRPAPVMHEFARYTGIGDVGLAGVILIAFVVNGLGEETGWRGFAADRLLETRGVARTSLLVAVMWAGWHVPLFFVVQSFRSMGAGGTAGWVPGLTAGSVVLTWIYRGSRRSVLLVAAWHTAFNLTAATEATAGTVAAVSSTVVMLGAVIILTVESRRRGPTSRTNDPGGRAAPAVGSKSP